MESKDVREVCDYYDNRNPRSFLFIYLYGPAVILCLRILTCNLKIQSHKDQSQITMGLKKKKILHC